jgi:P2 family phage contractile tail tube protein
MAARDILKNFALFIDGRGYAGQVTEYNAPDLTLATEEFKAGGMDAPMTVEVGMEALTCSFALSAYSADVLSLWGVAPGSVVPLTVRGALESNDGAVKAVVHQMRGKITGVARGAWGGGGIPALTITMALDYYAETIDGVPITLIDVEGMIRVVAGVDRLGGIRAALGV